jgi:hypothetical protein
LVLLWLQARGESSLLAELQKRSQLEAKVGQTR